MNANRLIGLVAALCLGLMLGVLCSGDVYAIAAVLVGLGGALMLTVCLIGESE
jgi:hypothetical protein